MRVAPEIVLTNEERGELAKLVRSKLTSVRLAQRVLRPSKSKARLPLTPRVSAPI